LLRKGPKVPLELTGTKTLTSGVVMLEYRPAAK
jgi:hypothetical protein